jgi:LysM repeat protein
MRRLGLCVAAGVAAILFTIPSEASPAAATINGPHHHRVVSGESVWGIAEKYGANAEELVKLNNISFPDLILPGTVIQVPVRQEAPPPGGEYEVKPGDTLSHIAVRFDVPLAQLRDANQLPNIDLIIPGQRIKVVAAPPPTSAPTPTPMPAQLVYHPPDNPELDAIFHEMATAEGFKPGLIKAIAWLESGWRQDAVSPAGAFGLMQLTPTTAGWLEGSVFGQQLNEELSTYDNVKMGTRYLRLLVAATGDEDKAIASYYQGIGATLSGKMYEETKRYVELVRAIQNKYWPA